MEYRTSDQYDDEALDYYRRGMFREALRLFREGEARFPGDKDLLLGAAMAHLNLGDFVEASRILEDLRAKKPGSSDVLRGLAKSYLKLGRKEQAVACVREALETCERSAETANGLGRLVYEHGLLQEAVRCHAFAVRWDRDAAAGYVALGVCNHRLGRIQQAVRLLNIALELEPDNIEARSYLGNIHYDRRDLGRAREVWARIPVASLGDPTTLRRMKALADSPQGPQALAIDARLGEVLRGRDTGVMSLLDRLAPLPGPTGPR